MFQSAGITHRHGGTLQVQSEPGRGTTLTARFPVHGRAGTH
jgi:signal transduction histidine kinase